MQKIIVIAGATASGKSDLAINLALKKGGRIVNADSIQVYEDIPLMTARPGEQEMATVPHYLYGYLDCYQSLTVLDWLQKAAEMLKNLSQPIVVGGTGMYLDALINGISEIPPVPACIREEVRQMPIDEVKKQVRDCLAVDPQRQRRALEVQLATGKPLSWFQQQPKKKYMDADFIKIWLNPPRDILYERCNQRFLKMLDQGAVKQVADLNLKDPTGGVTKAIGYSQITAYLNGEVTYEQMILSATQATRNYAKRQITWFKHQFQADYTLTDLSQGIDLS